MNLRCPKCNSRYIFNINEWKRSFDQTKYIKCPYCTANSKREEWVKLN